MIGTRLAHYEITTLLGSGGMGEVYRARDTKLNRDVALKILPEAFAFDAERIARFKREAQVLASLNHPNIGAIFGFEDADSVHALVLELVDGPTLADRIAEGRLPIDDALPIARQIAEALEAAHEQGIVHRDLKPANIKLRPDGAVKVLDFGLAKLLDADTATVAQTRGFSPGLTNSPTMTTPAMTIAGVVLGTAAYMSPEQARGKPVDRRADIWAFGIVLFELLTGKRPFDGETISDVLARVIEREPDWTALPETTPPRLRELVRRSLLKNPRTRLRDIGDARVQIEELLTGTRQESASVPIGGSDSSAIAVSRRRLMTAVTAALTGGAAVATLATWVIMRPTPPARSQPIRFSVAAPPAQSLVNGNAQLVVSPDGRTIVWVATATGGTQLMVRALDELDAVPLRGSVNARLPFFSPDGKWVGFFADRELKKVSIAGGAAITVCRLPGAPRGASWGLDDTIIFSTGDTTKGLLRVPARGGDPTMLTKPDEANGEAYHISPMILPGGRAVLFTIVAKGTPEKRQIAVLDLKTARRKILIRSGSDATYVDSGHIVFEDAGALLAAPFDLARLEVLSDPVAVVERVLTVLGTPSFSVSPHGTLVYAPGGVGVAGAGTPRSLLWIDRRGGEEPIKLPLRTYTYPRLSPDGMKVAIDIRDQENDIWIADLTRLTLTRLTIDPANDFYPLWTPDGRRIIFNSNRTGAGDLFWQAADGTGTVERLTTTMNGPHYPYSISPDGRTLIYQDNQPKTGIDLSLVLFESLSTDGPHKLQSKPLIQTAFSETNAEISPDGHWLAYQSNESGKDEVYVRPFPNVDGGRWQISDGGGTRPLWARSGRELFYLDASGFLMATSVQTTPVFTAGNPTKVFNTRYFSGFGGAGQAVAGRTYDVSPDGKRFLMIKDNVASGQSSTPSVMVVVVGWQEELKQRVPVK